MELKRSAWSPCQNEHFVNTSADLIKSRYIQLFPYWAIVHDFYNLFQSFCPELPLEAAFRLQLTSVLFKLQSFNSF